MVFGGLTKEREFVLFICYANSSLSNRYKGALLYNIRCRALGDRNRVYGYKKWSVSIPIRSINCFMDTNLSSEVVV